MAHVTIGYMIFVPLLLLLIFLLPLQASLLMESWADSRRTIELREAGSHLASSMQQLYNSMNRRAISPGKATARLGIPQYIENIPYVGNATLGQIASANSSKVLEISLRLTTVDITVSTTATLGENAVWRDSSFQSNSSSVRLIAEKYPDGTIQMSFGG